MRKKFIVFGLLATFLISALSACSTEGNTQNQGTSENTLTVLNYGKYIDEAALKEF